MSHWLLSILLLVLAAVPFAILWKIRKSKHDGWLYLLASLSILFFTGALLIWAPQAYLALGGTSFIPKHIGDGAFDSQSYSGFLQVLFGVPVAVAGSLYAILLARQSERQSSQFNAYEIRKNFRDRMEQRNVIVGRFSKSLRDINNSAYILLAQVERAIAALPEDGDAVERSASRIRKETARIEDDGLSMLRAALEDYRNATIAVQEGGIILDKSPRPPLDTIKWHFYGDEKHKQEFVGSLLARDYQAVADRFLVRANRLSPDDLIRARLERMAQSIVRWSEVEEMHEYWTDIREFIMSVDDVTTANVSGASDYVGFRFIGPALIRADACRDTLETWKLTCRIDLGTAILLDSYLALPNKDQSIAEIQKWDEWKFLGGVVDEDQRKQLLALIPERDQHFPQVFSDEVATIRNMYTYVHEPAGELKIQATKARMSYRALFYHTSPDWMDTAYDDLATQITSDVPPSKRELVDHLACMAVGIQIARIYSARSSGMAAIDRIVQSMDGAVERQFMKLGAAGHREFRRCLLVIWAQQVDPDQRTDALKQLQILLAATTDTVLTVQLHLDLFDCHLALGNLEQASGHFNKAKTIIDKVPPKQLGEINWFERYKYQHPDICLEPQIVLMSLWLSGYLTKQPGEFTFGEEHLIETEIAMPDGFLPVIWSVLATTGFIHLPGDARPVLISCTENCFFDRMIAPGQGDWSWEPELLSKEIQRRIESARRASHTSFLDQFHEEF